MKKVWKIYFKLLIITLLIGFTINLTSCATSKKAKPCSQCPSYTMKIPYVDTIIFDEIHDHIYLDEQYYCIYIESFTTIETDTIYLEFYYETN